VPVRKPGPAMSSIGLRAAEPAMSCVVARTTPQAS
jgi:hypothetical protein